MTRKIPALLLLFGASSVLYGQALPTASRAGDLQVGAGFVLGRSDYEPGAFKGAAIYADYDFRPRLGVEAEFHQIDAPSGDQSFQRTYEIGARYHRSYGALAPYAKVLYGRGEFNYPYGFAELSYNLFALGAGADYALRDTIHLRAEYEFQSWSGFPDGGLRPQLITIGVAYHFSGSMRTHPR